MPPTRADRQRRRVNQLPLSHIRDGVSFERLFGYADLTANQAAARLAMLRGALFQFLIGTSRSSCAQVAMACGDPFSHAVVSAFALADFAARCGVDRKLMRREVERLAQLLADAARWEDESL